MPLCRKCETPFPVKKEIDGKVRNLQNRKYCLTCSPFGSGNTKKLEKPKKETKKEEKKVEEKPAATTEKTETKQTTVKETPKPQEEKPTEQPKE